MGLSRRKKGYLRRKIRARKKIFGTEKRPRLSIYRSLKHIYAEIIDDIKQRTLVSASSVSGEIKTKKSGGNIKGAELVGELVAKKALEMGITKIVFDRSGNLYHGRVKALADAARKAGLEF